MRHPDARPPRYDADTLRRFLRIAFNALTVLSLVLAVGVVIAMSMAANIYTRRDSIRFSTNCNVSLAGGDRAFAALLIWSDGTFGPYTGSIAGIASRSNGGARASTFPKVTGFGDGKPIYYRRITWSDGTTNWTFSIGLLSPLIASLILPSF